MSTLNRKFINLAPLITTILLASVASVFAQTANVKIAGSQSTNQKPSTSEARNKQACITTKVQEYVSKLGTPELTNADFEALVECGDRAVPILSQALKNDRAEVRASAAYALGQIGQAAYAAVPNLVMMLRDDSSDDVRAIAAYTLGRIGSKAEAAVPRLIAIFKNPDEDSVVQDQAAQALKEIGTKEAIIALNEPMSVERASSSAIGCRTLLCLRNLDPTALPTKVRNSVQNNTNSPLICQIPGIKSILPRCR